ncbi:hypothetical protein ACFWGN_17720 [Oerskovia sp. NPDC060338]|uniref:hypothetical protein n=1 Tax=Oerskovia sp. NPDC060338 TaxID=3347100 RepID=UPI00365D88F1
MKRLSIPVVAIGLVLALSGCSNASAEDETACLLFADANNRLNREINLWLADGRPADGRDAAKAEGLLLPGRVAEAAERATGELAILLRDAADYSMLNADGQNEDAGVAYLLTETSIYDKCEELGIGLEIVEMDA